MPLKIIVPQPKFVVMSQTRIIGRIDLSVFDRPVIEPVQMFSQEEQEAYLENLRLEEELDRKFNEEREESMHGDEYLLLTGEI